MKKFMTILGALTILLTSAVSFAQADSGKIDLKLCSTLMASPKVTRALAIASEQVNGSKIKLDCTQSNNGTRTTTKVLSAVIAGKVVDSRGNETIQKTWFKASIGDFFEITIYDVNIKTITMDEFVNFDQ